MPFTVTVWLSPFSAAVALVRSTYSDKKEEDIDALITALSLLTDLKGAKEESFSPYQFLRATFAEANSNPDPGYVSDAESNASPPISPANITEITEITAILNATVQTLFIDDSKEVEKTSMMLRSGETFEELEDPILKNAFVKYYDYELILNPNGSAELKTLNVPGDGHCFWYALVSSLYQHRETSGLDQIFKNIWTVVRIDLKSILNSLSPEKGGMQPRDKYAASRVIRMYLFVKAATNLTDEVLIVSTKPLEILSDNPTKSRGYFLDLADDSWHAAELPWSDASIRAVPTMTAALSKKLGEDTIKKVTDGKGLDLRGRMYWADQFQVESANRILQKVGKVGIGYIQRFFNLIQRSTGVGLITKMPQGIGVLWIYNYANNHYQDLEVVNTNREVGVPLPLEWGPRITKK